MFKGLGGYIICTATNEEKKVLRTYIIKLSSPTLLTICILICSLVLFNLQKVGIVKRDECEGLNEMPLVGI